MKNEKKLLQGIAGFKNSRTFASEIKKTSTGSLDEWLSQRSAKPCTAVRIRQEPRKASVCDACLFLLHEGHNGIETEGDDKRRKF